MTAPAGSEDAGLDDLLATYCEARGIDVPDNRDAKHLAGEVVELAEAMAVGRNADFDDEEQDAVAHEIADVALALAVIARSLGFVVEDCIAEKTEHDRGRDRPAGHNVVQKHWSGAPTTVICACGEAFTGDGASRRWAKHYESSTTEGDTQ